MGRGSRQSGATETVALSKALSFLLRHGAKENGVAMSSDGWVRVADALTWANRGASKYDEDAVRVVVRDNDKQRFSLREGSDGALEIRANQGHSIASIEVQMAELTAETAPERALHGTYAKAWPLIRAGGLSKMSRQHIHLARGMPGESGVISGMRGSCELLIWVDVRRAIASGIRFFESSNGVLLTGGVDGVLPPEYIVEVVDRRTGRAIALGDDASET